ncbi:unnamed protein product [Strongylus vulgaris]|uniref:MULE transposase domain-containing protein n=1 Tax=Strongylus vulgaris TaxID=40348 RepID=A0A3P7IJK6_STRVU|nr:unnamed protein product [Strongylus vulgaris]
MSVYFQQRYYRHPLQYSTYYQAPSENEEQQQPVPQNRVEVNPLTERRERPLYRGVKEVRSCLAYIFQYARKTAKPDTSTYVCMHCKKLKKYTAIRVKGEDFLDDPVMLDHSCLPVERTRDKAERLSYKVSKLCKIIKIIISYARIDYMVIFQQLREALVRANAESEELQLRFIVDFEMATINAARRVFPRFSVEGCSWHLSQAWVRKRNSLGPLHYMKGEGRCGRVIRWWRTLKGLPFLPRSCYHLVNALQTPPVDQVHPAYVPCQNFLDYLNSTWLAGPFSNMWCKYMVHEERTTNAAENYHGRLRRILMKKHPPLASLLLVFRAFTSVAKATLKRMEAVC